MDAWKAIYERRAARAYTDEPVARATLARLIDAAIQAPSAMNLQPWHFTIIQDRSLLDDISAHAKRHLLSAPATLPEGMRERLGDSAFHIFYHAPAVVLISGETNAAWAAEDVALAAENLMLGACALNLGTCWIGLAQAWLETAEGRKRIDLPGKFRPIAPIVVGHIAAASPAVPRKPPEINWIG